MGEDQPNSTAVASQRDRRVIAGVALLAVCTVVGARLLASGDDTVNVWQATRDLAVGTVPAEGDLVMTPDSVGQIREALLRHSGVTDVRCVPEDRDACDAAWRMGGTLAEGAGRSPARHALRDVVTGWAWPERFDVAA